MSDETAPEQPTATDTIKAIKEWLTFGIAVIAAVSGIIFWVQNVSDAKIERIEKDVTSIRSDMKDIQSQNGEILRLIGKLEGKIVFSSLLVFYKKIHDTAQRFRFLSPSEVAQLRLAVPHYYKRPSPSITIRCLPPK